MTASASMNDKQNVEKGVRLKMINCVLEMDVGILLMGSCILVATSGS
jgi:hypothetical protein